MNFFLWHLYTRQSHSHPSTHSLPNTKTVIYVQSLVQFFNSILALQITLSDLPCAEIPHFTLNYMKTCNRPSLSGGSNGVK